MKRFKSGIDIENGDLFIRQVASVSTGQFLRRDPATGKVSFSDSAFLRIAPVEKNPIYLTGINEDNDIQSINQLGTLGRRIIFNKDRRLLDMKHVNLVANRMSYDISNTSGSIGSYSVSSVLQGVNVVTNTGTSLLLGMGVLDSMAGGGVLTNGESQCIWNMKTDFSNITIQHESEASGTPNNTFNFLDGQDLIIPYGGFVEFVYLNNRWRIKGTNWLKGGLGGSGTGFLKMASTNLNRISFLGLNSDGDAQNVDGANLFDPKIFYDYSKAVLSAENISIASSRYNYILNGSYDAVTGGTGSISASSGIKIYNGTGSTTVRSMGSLVSADGFPVEGETFNFINRKTDGSSVILRHDEPLLPSTSDRNKFFFQNGQDLVIPFGSQVELLYYQSRWRVKATNSITGLVGFENHTHSAFTRAAAGFVPAPGGSTTTRYLREDGTWAAPPDTVYTHPSKGWVDKANLTGATVISNLTVDALGHPTNWVTRELTAANIGAQDTLVSGTNIKTVNGVTLLGSGDIVVTGGATNLSWTNGTTAGPTVNSSTGTNAVIPSASGTISGVVTTATQTFAGSKTFSGGIIATADNGIRNNHNGNGVAWYGRISSVNTTNGTSVFIGTYGTSTAGVFAHNSDFTQWRPLFANVTTTVDQGVSPFYMPASSFAGGNQIWHAGNLSPVVTVTANAVVRRDASGHIFANHVNFGSPQQNQFTITNFITDDGDGWSRRSSVAHAKNAIRAAADGMWGIDITGSSGFVRVIDVGGVRSLSHRPPNWTIRAVAFDFVARASVSPPASTGNYWGCMTFNPYDGTTASTGDSSYQLGFVNETGMNGSGFPGLRLRKGIDTSWGDFFRVLTEANTNSPLVRQTTGNQYYDVNTWLQLNGPHGMYSVTNSAHIQPNTNSTYGAWSISGSRTGWGGIRDNYSGNNFGMYDAAGNGGTYNENWGKWVYYYNRSHDCFAINGSTTLSNYRVYANGVFGASGDIVAFASSDRRLKDNIRPIEHALDKVLNLSGNTFTWKEKDYYHKGTDYGVIAQEVEALFPEMVTTRETGFKAVRYEKLIPVMIEAIKELNDKIKKLGGK